MLDDIVTGYLRRLGLDDPGPPSVDALGEIHRAQVERIAYNTVDIQLGRPASITPVAAARHIAETGRGGYCFNQNGALSYLLERLGYQVTRHRGAVWSEPDATLLEPFANHLVLTVHALPTSDNPGGSWFVDSGLGDALHDPLPLVAGLYRQGPQSFEFGPSQRLDGGWHFQHDPTGSFRAMDFESDVAAPDAFDAGHAHLSTSPDSGFVKYLTVARRDATGVDQLTSRTLKRVEGTRTVDWELPRQDWFAALADVFGITLDDVDAGSRDALWRRVSLAHDEWKARDAS